ncbi:flavin reductase family protein [Sinorhizobium prairiense]|uniref:flavin reductase family protein n=1 Tax=unclassified Sinorhizobium TaxID=2613772 RepID=UPI0023D8C254|nr:MULTISPECIES: flavin reductase family protein [unclassified Sinorhizobium]WEJ08404.1 flavin reductase family protein [Sinorhizobium sp. M103]WEJ14089.1 flavin reductase family protein [Sinorhizobium sp. K101]WEJ35691.1 flavin reductase family protein [Sinorhizobium sp. C101]
MADTSTDAQSAFKAAMRRFTSTICLITTELGGVRHGMAATAVQSVTAEPPTVLVCINQSASISQPLKASGKFAVNMLHLSHAGLVPLFSGKLKGEERFHHGKWLSLDGMPVLSDAQAAFVCQLKDVVHVGTHDVVLGEVLEARFIESIAPLLYENGQLVRSSSISGPAA